MVKKEHLPFCVDALGGAIVETLAAIRRVVRLMLAEFVPRHER